jgi:hypothetical protein
MTMPHERLRAIGWGRDLLVALQHDPGVSEPLQAEARLLAHTYLNAEELLELISADAGASDFPPQAGRSIEKARSLFEAAQYGGVGGAETRRQLLFTLRHFPPAGWARIASNAARTGSLHEWLATDPDCDRHARPSVDGSDGERHS